MVLYGISTKFIEEVHEMNASKNREQKLRRALKKVGYEMHKSRAAISANNFGGYMLCDIQLWCVVANSSRFNLTLDDIEEWLED